MTILQSRLFSAALFGLAALLTLADGKYLAAFAFTCAVSGQIELWALRTGRIE